MVGILSKFGQGWKLVKKVKICKVLRMGLPIVENLSGLQESIFNLSRGPQLHFCEKSKNWSNFIKFADFSLFPLFGVPWAAVICCYQTSSYIALSKTHSAYRSLSMEPAKKRARTSADNALNPQESGESAELLADADHPYEITKKELWGKISEARLLRDRHVASGQSLASFVLPWRLDTSMYTCMPKSANSRNGFSVKFCMHSMSECDCV